MATRVVVSNRLYTKHETLGWLLMGSWGWQQVTCAAQLLELEAGLRALTEAAKRLEGGQQ